MDDAFESFTDFSQLYCVIFSSKFDALYVFLHGYNLQFKIFDFEWMYYSSSSRNKFHWITSQTTLKEKSLFQISTGIIYNFTLLHNTQISIGKHILVSFYTENNNNLFTQQRNQQRKLVIPAVICFPGCHTGKSQLYYFISNEPNLELISEKWKYICIFSHVSTLRRFRHLKS